MVIPSSSEHSYSSSEEDSKIPRPEMKISAAEARAKINRSLKDAKEIINSVPLDHLKVVRDGLLKREVEDEKLATYQQKRRRLQQKRLEAEDETRSRADSVASNSDVEEIESAWEPIGRKVKPHPPSIRVERLARADFKAECEEDDYLDAMYNDPEDDEEVLDSENSSKKESDEDSTEDDNCRDDDESETSESDD
ncbi:nucleolar complex protein 2 homolog [Papaver somniferum]|uniref:nucleolar complex protein 2 homolog n=1 Tax=Papaver somniferum TaxID=3469 RepID=UPI000E6F8B8B|nr:nucleolar complex protein 2 homolog [Papaver somniferum]